MNAAAIYRNGVTGETTTGVAVESRPISTRAKVRYGPWWSRRSRMVWAPSDQFEYRIIWDGDLLPGWWPQGTPGLSFAHNWTTTVAGTRVLAPCADCGETRSEVPCPGPHR